MNNSIALQRGMQCQSIQAQCINEENPKCKHRLSWFRLHRDWHVSWGQLGVTCTSAGLFHMDELIWKAHDIRILLLAHISEEVKQCLLQVSWFGVTQLNKRAKRSAVNQKVFNVCMCCQLFTLFCLWASKNMVSRTNLFNLVCVHITNFTLHKYDMEKPNAFPLREPEFI